MEEVKNNALSESETIRAIDEAVNILGTQTGVLSNALKLMEGKYGGHFTCGTSVIQAGVVVGCN